MKSKSMKLNGVIQCDIVAVKQLFLISSNCELHGRIPYRMLEKAGRKHAEALIVIRTSGPKSPVFKNSVAMFSFCSCFMFRCSKVRDDLGQEICISSFWVSLRAR